MPEVSDPEPVPAPVENPPTTEEQVEIPLKLFFFTDSSSDIKYLEMLLNQQSKKIFKNLKLTKAIKTQISIMKTQQKIHENRLEKSKEVAEINPLFLEVSDDEETRQFDFVD